MPTKIIVTHEGAMRKKYGRRWPTIKAAVKKLITADKRRGITSTLVPLDSARFGRMRARTGAAATFKDAIDHAYGLYRKPDYIAILGGPDIVPHQDLINPLTGDDRKDDPVVPSDLPYACDTPTSDDVSTFLGPSRVVGRIPDLPNDRNPALLLALLARATRWEPASTAGSDYFGLSTYMWRRSTSRSLKALFGRKASPRLSPHDGPQWTAAELLPPWHFINCHGAPIDTRFYGQKKRSYPIAHDASLLPRKIARGTVVTAECCYGGQLFDPAMATGPGIAVTYLREGAIGFMDADHLTVPADLHRVDAASRRIGQQTLRRRIGPQRDVRPLDRRTNAAHVGFTLRVPLADKRVARVAENTAVIFANPEQAQRQWRGMEPLAPKLFDNGRHLRRVRHRRVWVRRTRRLRRILTLGASHVIQMLRTVVIRRQRVVVDRPRRRQAVDMFDRVEVLAAQPIEHAAPELGVPADAVMCIGGEFPSALVEPPFPGAIA